MASAPRLRDRDDIIDGVFRHQDSNGGGGLITNGDTQWMTAGGGILHIEVPPEELVGAAASSTASSSGSTCRSRLKMTQPRYQDIRAGQVALLTSADGGALLRVIAGSLDGHAGRAARTPRSPWCTPPSRPARRSRSRGRPTSTRSATCWRASGTVGGRAAADPAPGSSRRSALASR